MSDKTYASKASKGFSKHIGPNTQILLGVIVVIFSITPAIFFSLTLTSPYYTIKQSSCDIPLLHNLTLYSNAVSLPAQQYYSATEGITSMGSQMSWWIDDHWTMLLHKGVCPNGIGMKDDGTHEGTYCLPYRPPTPDIWQLIDVYDQQLIQEGYDLPYVDFEQGAKNFRQAWMLAIPSCVFAWIFIIASLISAVRTDEHIELKLDRQIHEVDQDTATPEELAEHILHIEEMQDEHIEGNESYTKAIATEFTIYLLMFGMATSILKLVEESDLVLHPQAWQGFYPTCNINLQPEAGVGILYYQCVSMGIYVCTLAAAEVYYLSEYINHCMHEYLTHPSEREELRLHADSSGDSSKIPNKWKGPVFMTRLHLLKVRAVKQTYFLIYGLFYHETVEGRKFREAHESQKLLSEKKDKLKQSHHAKTGHKDLAASKKLRLGSDLKEKGEEDGPAPPPPHPPMRGPEGEGTL